MHGHRRLATTARDWKQGSLLATLLLAGLVGTGLVAGNRLDMNNPTELGIAAAAAARNLIALYPNSEDGAFSQDYVSWFHSGMIWGALLDTKKYVGDGDVAFVGANLAKASFGKTGDFLDGPNRSFQETTEGKWNDDILWWAMSTMKYIHMMGNNETLPGGAKPLDVVLTTWAQVAEQWDDKCGGGVYWARGRASNDDSRANYKSTISNVQMSLLSAQLFKFTGDAKYREFADKIIAWLQTAGLLDAQNHLYDGLNVRDCAGSINKAEWSYSPGCLIGTYAWLYDATKDERYQDAGEALLQTILVQFVNDDVISETICEPDHIGQCPRDQPSFKAILVRYLSEFYALTNRPRVKEQIKRIMDASALAMIDRHWTTPEDPVIISVRNQHTAVELFNAVSSIYRVTAPEAVDVNTLVNTVTDQSGSGGKVRRLKSVTGGGAGELAGAAWARAGATLLTVLVFGLLY